VLVFALAMAVTSIPVISRIMADLGPKERNGVQVMNVVPATPDAPGASGPMVPNVPLTAATPEGDPYGELHVRH
jgi:hypothetical protein